MAAYRFSTSTLIILNFLCVLLFRCDTTDPNDVYLDCFNESERFNSNRNVSIRDQKELDNFVENIATSTDGDIDRCIQLYLTGESYRLDVIKLMQVKLGTGGGLVVVGVISPQVKITCVASLSTLEELRSALNPISNVSLVALYGLMFSGCPVPIVLEEVSTVIVQNCNFM